MVVLGKTPLATPLVVDQYAFYSSIGLEGVLKLFRLIRVRRRKNRSEMFSYSGSPRH